MYCSYRHFLRLGPVGSNIPVREISTICTAFKVRYSLTLIFSKSNISCPVLLKKEDITKKCLLEFLFLRGCKPVLCLPMVGLIIRFEIYYTKEIAANPVNLLLHTSSLWPLPA
jgi:hypothetical protein